MFTITTIDAVKKLSETKPTILLITGDNCPNCGPLKSEVEDFISTKKPKVNFVQINATEHRNEVIAIGVRTVPTMVAYVDGIVKGVKSGPQAASDIGLFVDSL